MPSSTVVSPTINFDDLTCSIAQSVNDANAYKSALAEGHERIYQQFCDSKDAWQAIKARSSLVDSALVHSWREFVNRRELALVAVGGYGRGELHPYSDVDLMILVDEKSEPELEPLIAKFIAHLWDSGLDVGHSVRTVGQCIEQSLQDVTVITNLMESRLLVGCKALHQSMLHSIRPERIWPADDFFPCQT